MIPAHFIVVSFNRSMIITMTPTHDFKQGFRDGLPICFGYISVSFAFGMMAAEGGLPVWTAVLISMTNLTSSGQVAGTTLLLTNGSFLEIAVTTLVINIRYMLMSLSLSQKIHPAVPVWQRCLLAFGNTDEIFAVSMRLPRAVTAHYLMGLIAMPYVGWTLGTLLGAAATGILPLALRSALGIAIYGMFLAIIVPPARTLRPVLLTVIIAAVLSCLLRFLPVTRELSGGWVIIICAFAASLFAAWKFPVIEEEES